MKIARILICTLFTWIMALSLLRPVAAESLVLTLATAERFDLGEQLTISGNLTLNGAPVADGLVTIQIQNPRGNNIVVRTLNTGTDPPRPWIIEILEFYTCDLLGQVQTSFPVGSVVGFTVRLINNASSTQTVVVPVYIQYASTVPFMSFIIYNSTIDGGKTANVTAFIQMPDNAPIGTTHAYASALTGYPSDGGYAYSPEEATTFEITTLALGASSRSQAESSLDAGGSSFSMIFKTNPHGGVLGNYTIYAASWYYPRLISTQKTLNIVLTGDITGPQSGVPDGKVDVRDVSRVARAFGSHAGPPPSSNWDPICDITGPTPWVPDGKVDARDVAWCARNFGKYGASP
jgi:hypothetical protein